ncbi:MAG: metallophosphoesterase [Bacteroidetes bacterium]|nr:metallophosphoesterase [Bacteroidota bacterium]MCL2328149.1 metallophosphoesterase [Bacteroidota bacterium]
MKLIAISDPHLPSLNESIANFDANSNFLKVISAIRNKQFDALLILGDIAYKNANKHSYQLFSNGLANITQDIYCLPGNHDEWNLLYKIMQPRLKNTTSCFEQKFGSAPFLFLDSSSGEISKEYVEQFLHNHTDQAVFLCAHHPIVPTQAQYMEQRYALRNKQEILDLLVSHSAPVTVISGHYHCSTESLHKNVRQIVVPSLLYQIPLTAKKFAIDNRFGFCEITILGGSCEVKTEWL